MNSFYENPTYSTWSDIKTGDPHMLDAWSTNSAKIFRNCAGCHDFGLPNSDHIGVIAEIVLTSIPNKRETQISTGIIDWKTIQTDEIKNKEFNERLREHLANLPLYSYTEFGECVIKAAQMTAMKPKTRRTGWFEESSSTLQPLLDKKYTALAKMKSVPEAVKPLWKEKLNERTKLVKEAVEVAKAKWTSRRAEKLNQMDVNPKEAWKMAREIEAGVTGHHAKTVAMKMKMENGKLASNDKENMKVMAAHFTKVYNTRRECNSEAVTLLKQRETLEPMGDPISWSEFKKAVVKLQNDKSPGENEVPPNAFKSMDAENLGAVYEYICDFWEGNADYDEWHTGLVKLLPKKNDLSSPHNWRGINLMDVCSKILSSILAQRAFQLLDLHCTKSQFGGTPKVGCQDGQFTLKTLLHLRHQHNLETHVMFVDLVKAYDTANHKMLIDILQRYGAPEKFTNAIERLYANLKVKIRIGKEEEEISQTVGVRQGDPLSPVIFLFIISAVSEVLRIEFEKEEIPSVLFKKVEDNELVTEGQLTSHNLKSLKRLQTNETFEVIDIFFVDDGAFPFPSREAMTKAAPIIDRTLKRFDLLMHVGKTCENGKESKAKTECVYYPPPGSLDPITIQPELDPTITNALVIKQKKETPEAIAKRRRIAYNESNKTKRIHLPSVGFVDYSHNFKYLGTLTSFDLKDDQDIQTRVNKASQQMGALKNVWQSPTIDLKAKSNCS